MSVTRIFFCIVLLCGGPSALAETTLLKFAMLIDGSGEVLDANEIIVENGVITAIGNDLAVMYPNAAETLLENLTALPGLIDAHVHMTYGLSGSPKGDAWNELFSTPAADRLVEATRNAQRTLDTGVTAARDLFAFDGLAYQLKALIDNDVIPGPRLFVAGEGIHPLTLTPLAAGEERDPITEFSKQAQRRVAEAADWVKIFASTGTADDLTSTQLFFYPEIKAATDIAHAAGVRVAVHTYGAAAVDDALRAGVDSIEHPVGLDDEILVRWARTQTLYVPTIDHNRYYADHRKEYGYDEDVERDLREFVQRNVQDLRRAHAAGIRIAMGSDAVMTMFGQNTRELEWFVEAGMTTKEAIQAATLNGALLLGQEENLGRLRTGFAADIIAVEGNPLTDIRALTRTVRWVMKDGQVVVDHREKGVEPN